MIRENRLGADGIHIIITGSGTYVLPHYNGYHALLRYCNFDYCLNQPSILSFNSAARTGKT